MGGRAVTTGLLAALTLMLLSSVNTIAAGRTCSTLSCEKCTSICTAACDAEAKTCDAGGVRGCPGKFRSCQRGCPSMLCAQCLPVQYVEGGKKFLPGKTELCRTGGQLDTGKK